LDDSLSGSASSSDNDSDSDAVSSLVNKTKKLLKPDVSDYPQQPTVPVTPLIWFHSPPSTQVGVYRAIFPVGAETDSYLDSLKAMQEKAERKWAIFMLAGGHFAGAIVRVSRSDAEEEEEEEEQVADGKKKKKKKSKPKPDTEVLRHKTFHRYTSEFYSVYRHDCAFQQI
jgi:hypothetical protein